MVKVSWDDPDRTVLLYEFSKSWDWPDFYAEMAVGEDLIAEINRPIIAIFDLSKSERIPDNVISHARVMLQQANPLIKLYVVVGTYPMLGIVLGMVRRIFPHTRLLFEQVDTAHAARELVEKRLKNILET